MLYSIVMVKKIGKSKKTKDRFEEIKNEILAVIKTLDAKAGLQIEDLSDKLKHVAEMVVHNTETLSAHGERLDTIQEDIQMIKFDLKDKTNNFQTVSLARRITLLEKKVTNLTNIR